MKIMGLSGLIFPNNPLIESPTWYPGTPKNEWLDGSSMGNLRWPDRPDPSPSETKLGITALGIQDEVLYLEEHHLRKCPVMTTPCDPNQQDLAIEIY